MTWAEPKITVKRVGKFPEFWHVLVDGMYLWECQTEDGARAVACLLRDRPQITSILWAELHAISLKKVVTQCPT
jgi:hypothetical protein